MKSLIQIIVVTCDNAQYLNPCLTSILNTGILNGFAELTVVNNGNQPLEKEFGHFANVNILKTGENIGWERALQIGLEQSEAPFVVFQNDDTLIPRVSNTIFEKLLMPFADKRVGIVGPTTTVAAGYQSIYHPYSPRTLVEAPYLIFFMAMVRREYLDEVGGVDATLPGGDDLDLCIRMRKAGYKCLIAPDAFVIHEAFKTGERVRGGPNVAGGWNSQEMRDATNQALIRKHGFKTFIETISGGTTPFSWNVDGLNGREEDVIRKFVQGEKIVELGCGPTKLFPHSIGVDIAPAGTILHEHEARTSIADVVADVTQPLPESLQDADTIIASHIFEHCLDSIATLKHWASILRPGGRLIISTPDETVTSGIPLNPEHCHAFTQESLRHLGESIGLTHIASESARNGVSFVACFEKNGQYAQPS